MDWGAVAVIAREVSPGSYTFTVNLLQATEASGGSYVFEKLEQVTVTVIVEGNVIEDGSSDSAEEDSLLPGPSFISVISLLAIIVYRKRK